MDLYIGLMSGTSMDGIDAVVVDVAQNKLIGGLTREYSTNTYNALVQLVDSKLIQLPFLLQVNTLIGNEFADAVGALLNKVSLDRTKIRAIGSHGQTVIHNAQADIPYTLQLGCPHTIASRTGISVVADLRTRDLVVGGKGAPFAPAYHEVVFDRSNKACAVVNIGGIANLTLLDKNSPTKGWDVGPGNCLMDAWVRRHKNEPYDKEGAWARGGRVLEGLLEAMLADSFFQLVSPKSIGKEYFSLDWLQSFDVNGYQPEDVQATLLMLSAQCIVDGLKSVDNVIKLVYLCGGGAHNQLLLETLSKLLPSCEVKSCIELGISPDYLEAMMCAWIASKTINQQPIDLTQITGANAPQILGAVIYP